LNHQQSGSSTTNTKRDKTTPQAPSNLSHITRKLDNDEEDDRELLPIRDSLDNLDISNTPKEK
jgi:hypothetical protein